MEDLLEDDCVRYIKTRTRGIHSRAVELTMAKRESDRLLSRYRIDIRKNETKMIMSEHTVLGKLKQIEKKITQTSVCDCFTQVDYKVQYIFGCHIHPTAFPPLDM